MPPDCLLRLPALDTQAVLEALQQRYASDRVYTWAGRTLLAVNPYQELEDPSFSVPLQGQPHPFAVAELALQSLRTTGTNQAILISGESGAGKTETTKRVLSYVGHALQSHGLEARLLASNPLMEAMGNASTSRNDNSSRFGKFVKITTDRTGTRMLSANIDTYLLERSRVTGPQPNEGNFHLLYQVWRTDPNLRFLLPHPFPGFPVTLSRRAPQRSHLQMAQRPAGPARRCAVGADGGGADHHRRHSCVAAALPLAAAAPHLVHRSPTRWPLFATCAQQCCGSAS